MVSEILNCSAAEPEPAGAALSCFCLLKSHIKGFDLRLITKRTGSTTLPKVRKLKLPFLNVLSCSGQTSGRGRTRRMILRRPGTPRVRRRSRRAKRDAL